MGLLGTEPGERIFPGSLTAKAEISSDGTYGGDLTDAANF